ncbi:hypothetical protein AB1Y20_020259 [Prymnesium parvum]|uniref:Uncharacterized protein n=1 Tax=Prymnesium parvum TaxID=97485 RepID=A0AB34JXM0_PRYPA
MIVNSLRQRNLVWPAMSKGPVVKSTDPNPVKDFFADDLKDPFNTVPKHLKGLEDAIDDYVGKPYSHLHAVASIPGVGVIKSHESFRENADYKECMANIKAAAEGKY